MKSINRTIIIAGGLALSGIIVAGLAIASQSGHFGQRTHHQGFHAKKLDTNGDGMLTREEMLAKNAARFTSLDKDGSGSITADEFSANLAQMFDRLDANGDGMLAPDEVPRRANRLHYFDHHHGHPHKYRHIRRHETGLTTIGSGLTTIDASPLTPKKNLSRILIRLPDHPDARQPNGHDDQSCPANPARLALLGILK